jgi:hypothetical protein
MVVLFLGLALLGAILGSTILAGANGKIPDILLAIGSASVGAIAGLLAPPPGSNRV